MRPKTHSLCQIELVKSQIRTLRSGSRNAHILKPSFFPYRWGAASLTIARQTCGSDLQDEYASRERLLRELRLSPVIVGAPSELGGAPLCRHLSGVLDLLLVEQIEVCQAHAATLLQVSRSAGPMTGPFQLRVSSFRTTKVVLLVEMAMRAEHSADSIMAWFSFPFDLKPKTRRKKDKKRSGALMNSSEA
jgi:hypothetical protein